jgi:hypothetical protein
MWDDGEDDNSLHSALFFLEIGKMSAPRLFINAAGKNLSQLHKYEGNQQLSENLSSKI